MPSIYHQVYLTNASDKSTRKFLVDGSTNWRTKGSLARVSSRPGAKVVLRRPRLAGMWQYLIVTLDHSSAERFYYLGSSHYLRVVIVTMNHTKVNPESTKLAWNMKVVLWNISATAAAAKIFKVFFVASRWPSKVNALKLCPPPPLKACTEILPLPSICLNWNLCPAPVCTPSINNDCSVIIKKNVP